MAGSAFKFSFSPLILGLFLSSASQASETPGFYTEQDIPPGCIYPSSAIPEKSLIAFQGSFSSTFGPMTWCISDLKGGLTGTYDYDGIPGKLRGFVEPDFLSWRGTWTDAHGEGPVEFEYKPEKKVWQGRWKIAGEPNWRNNWSAKKLK